MVTQSKITLACTAAGFSIGVFCVLFTMAVTS